MSIKELNWVIVFVSIFIHEHCVADNLHIIQKDGPTVNGLYDRI